MPAEVIQAESAQAIWILDDSALELELARRTLQACLPPGTIELFQDGATMLEALAAGRLPDVLVCDWLMPDLSGIEVCRFIRTQPRTRELSVLLLTSNQDPEQIVQGLQAGANDYLTKPYSPDELGARVSALVRARALLERAERAEAMLLDVLSQLPDAVVTLDPSGKVAFANPQAEVVFGVRRDALVGRPLPVPVPSPFDAAPEEGRPDVHILGRLHSPRVIPPSHPGGYTTVTLRDVTEVREQEGRRVDFYSMVAHDLRSPLNALQLRVEVILQGLRGALSGEVRDDLLKIGRQALSMSRIVTDFLDRAQMQSAHYRIEPLLMDLSAPCAQLIDEYQPVAASRGISLTAGALPGVMVAGDVRRLAQAVGNLLSNALKFTPRGGRVALRTRRVGAFAELEVEDTGPGIPRAAQPRLFRKYQRVAGSAPRVEGSGLGLVIVKEIVEAHGGTVGVVSREGGGSRFWLRLPGA